MKKHAQKRIKVSHYSLVKPLSSTYTKNTMAAVQELSSTSTSFPVTLSTGKSKENMKHTNNAHGRKRANSDKTIWKKNWFDVDQELPDITNPQKYAMITAYIKKINTYPTDDLTKLLYTLRVRAMILIFFGFDTFDNWELVSGYQKSINSYREFLSRDLALYAGWYEPRSKDEDDVIGGYQYAYALAASGEEEKIAEAGAKFTAADKMFGYVRHTKYLSSLKTSEDK